MPDPNPTDRTVPLRARSSDTAALPPPQPLPPTGPDVPGYELLEEVGRGGMGVVYKARQTALGRVVAIKTILTGTSAGRFDLVDLHERLLREAEAVARLNHPNVIQVFEVGTCPTGPFLVMEFLPGGNLSRRLDGKPQPPRTAAGVAATLSRAVHAAHCQGLVHRDLKPANILIAEGPDVPLGRATVKVSDFGLVR
ncbi:MAG: serine/threonine-protein kinase, partial [Gemmataceae bacterium]